MNVRESYLRALEQGTLLADLLDSGDNIFHSERGERREVEEFEAINTTVLKCC